MESVHEWLLAKGLGETVANIDSIEFECVEDFFELTMADVDDMAKEYGWKLSLKTKFKRCLRTVRDEIETLSQKEDRDNLQDKRCKAMESRLNELIQEQFNELQNKKIPEIFDARWETMESSFNSNLKSSIGGSVTRSSSNGEEKIKPIAKRKFTAEDIEKYGKPITGDELLEPSKRNRSKKGKRKSLSVPKKLGQTSLLEETVNEDEKMPSSSESLTLVPSIDRRSPMQQVDILSEPLVEGLVEEYEGYRVGSKVKCLFHQYLYMYTSSEEKDAVLQTVTNTGTLKGLWTVKWCDGTRSNLTHHPTSDIKAVIEEAKQWKQSQTLECNGSVKCCVITNDGSMVIAGDDNCLKIWDLNSSSSGKLLTTLEGHVGMINCVAVSNDDQLIVSGSKDGACKIWTIEDGKCVKTLEGHTGEVNCIAISEDTEIIVSGGGDFVLKVWKRETGELIQALFDHTDIIYSCDISHDYKTVVSGSHDKSLKIWDIETGECLKTLEGHSDSITSSIFAMQDTFVLSSSRDTTLKFWTVKTGECFQTLTGHTDLILGAILSRDNKFIVSSSVDMTIKVWNTEWNYTHTLEGNSDMIFCCCMSTANDVICSGSIDSKLVIWRS